MVLMSTDLPAPLSPARAVTWPAGTSRSTSTRARTGPKLLLTPRRRRSGTSASTPSGSVVWSARCVPVLIVSCLPFPRLFDSGRRARALRLGHADVGCLDEAVLHHGGGHVLRRHPRRRQVRRLHVRVGLGVLRGGVDEAGGRRLAGPEVERDGRRCLCLQVDRLVHRAALEALQDVL